MKTKKTKKLISRILAFTMLLTLFPGIQSAQADTPTGDYNIDPATGTIVQYLGAGGDVVIPSTIAGVPVTRIADLAFCNKDTVTSVVVPEGVTTIGDSAFSYCEALVSVDLPDSVTTMGEGVFQENINLKNVSLPAGLTSIPNRTFLDASIKNILLPNTVTSIGNSAFSGSSIEKIELPSGLTTIGEYAFTLCNTVKIVKIPDSVTTIGKGAFQDCNGLKNAVFTSSGAITLDVGVFPSYTKVYYPVGATGYSDPWNGWTTIAYDPSKTYTVTFDGNGADGGSVTTLSGLKTGDVFTLPENGFTATGRVFLNWSGTPDGRRTIMMPGNIMPILVDDLTAYAQWAYPITFETTPHGKVSRNVFSPELNPIGAKTGEGVDVLITADIGYRLKSGSLKFIDNAGEHPLEMGKAGYRFTMPSSAVTVTAEFIEGDYEFDKDSGTIKGYNGRGGNVIIPSTIDGVAVTAIGSGAFCSEMAMQQTDPLSITGIVIPEGVTRINYGAFAGLSNLKGVTLPSTLTDIRYRAFADCYELKSIKIPASVTNINDEAFDGCRKLNTAKFEGLFPTTLGINIFNGADPNFDILFHATNPKVDSSPLDIYRFRSIESIIGSSAVAQDVYGLELVYASRESKDSVNNNLYLSDICPVTGSNVSWVSSNPAVIGNDGLVTRPDANSNDAKVDLTATITNNGASNTKVFSLTVPSLATYYTVTFDKNGGDAEASPTSKVVISGKYVDGLPTAPTKSGYTFNGWNTAANGSGTAFTASTVVTADTTVYAQWTKDSVLETKYTVTFNKNGGDTEASPTSKAVISGKSVNSLPTAPTKSGYTFNGWNTVANGSGTAFTANTVVTADTTVYAQWTIVPSGGGSTGGSSGGSSDDTDKPSSKPSKESGTSSTPVVGGAAGSTPAATGTQTPPSLDKSTVLAETKNDSTGKAVASVSESQVKAAIDSAKLGNDKKVNVEIALSSSGDVKSIEASLPKGAVQAMVTNNVDNFKVTSAVASITFDKGAVKTISKEAGADVKFAVTKVDATGLSEEVKRTIGDHPVYDFSVTSGDKTISEFGGEVTVSVPYTLKPGEDASAVVVYYVNNEGTPEIISNSKYESSTGKAIFSTTHFSTYAVSYNKVSFKDVTSSSEYNKAISFIAARGITTGTGGGKFSPESTLTRGQFMVMLMKAYGIEPDKSSKDNFADAGNTYYTNYLSAAKHLGLTNGTGNNTYSPEKEISQQEMISLIYKTLKVMGKLPTADNSKTLTAYKDANLVAPWAKDSMELFVKASIVAGQNGKLEPTKKASRAQMAQVLFNLLSK